MAEAEGCSCQGAVSILQELSPGATLAPELSSFRHMTPCLELFSRTYCSGEIFPAVLRTRLALGTLSALSQPHHQGELPAQILQLSHCCMA